MNGWIRKLHRWTSIVFLAIVGFLFVLQAFTSPAEWAYYLPLLPLVLLMPTGLYMFLRPYWRSVKQ